MKLLSLLLCLILFTYVFSLEEDAIKNMQDMQKCNAPNNNAYVTPITTKICTSITPTLEAGGDYKGECCKVTANTDPLFSFKASYHENWKQKVCETLGVSENTSEEELRKKLSYSVIKDQCTVLKEKSLLADLYSTALLTVDGKVSYDCGSGEKSFSASDFFPTNENEQMTKDILDCNVEYTEKNCGKRGTKLGSSNTQCCWCETTYLNPVLPSAQTCMGYTNDKFKNSLNTMMTSFKSAGLNVEYKCSCTNKNGGSVRGSFSTVSGEVTVE
jgi:hypothetical protein